MRHVVAALLLCACAGAPQQQSIIPIPGGGLDASANLDDMAQTIIAADMSVIGDVGSSWGDMDPGAADMAEPDMTPACGTEVGAACCTAPAQACATRDPQSRFLVCHNGTCALCGTQGQLCCDGNACYGATACAGPQSAFAGYCE